MLLKIYESTNFQTGIISYYDALLVNTIDYIYFRCFTSHSGMSFFFFQISFFKNVYFLA